MLKNVPEDFEGLYSIKHHCYVCEAVQYTQRVKVKLIVVVLSKAAIDCRHLG